MKKKISIDVTLDKDKKEIIDVKLFGLYNEIDWAIIFYLGKKDHSVGELTRKLNIAPVNVWKHIKKLSDAGVVVVPDVARGKKKILSLNKEAKHLADLANQIALLKYQTKKD